MVSLGVRHVGQLQVQSPTFLALIKVKAVAKILEQVTARMRRRRCTDRARERETAIMISTVEQ